MLRAVADAGRPRPGMAEWRLDALFCPSFL